METGAGMLLRRCFVGSLFLTLVTIGPARADVILGAFDFDSALFGNTLQESDGGSFSFGNWLNVVNADPGNPAYLTGANFDTGIANIGVDGEPPTYTIGYGLGILNGSGDDLGIVVARFSEDDFSLSVSVDGVGFTSPVFISSATAVSTGVGRNYFYGGNGPYSSTLYVHSIDLSSLGIAAGDSITAVQIQGFDQLDLVRAAGFDNADAVPEVPEPGTLVLVGFGALSLLARRRQGRS